MIIRVEIAIMKSETQLKEIIRNYLTPPYNELYKELIKRSVRIESSEDELITFGNSKFGGNPHVESYFE